jgi:hypothetical protein
MVVKIISGGQSGADQGGLYGARDVGIPTGGFAPYSFLTEGGSAPWLSTKFGLEDSGVGYRERTEKNVKASDITLWFGTSSGSAGFWATRNAAMKFGKIFKEIKDMDTIHLSSLLDNYQIMNIAGNRESHYPGLCKSTRERIRSALMMIKSKQVKLYVS